MTRLDRFMSCVHPEPNSGCWLWAGAVDGNGYGKIKIGGRYEGAHRLAYKMFRCQIPQGLWVLHRCDTPLCVNPAHLFLGTVQDNNADMTRKGRHRNGVRYGEAQPASRLTDESVRAIRCSSETNVALARVLGVSESTVRRARSAISWRMVT